MLYGVEARFWFMPQYDRNSLSQYDSIFFALIEIMFFWACFDRLPRVAYHTLFERVK